MNFSEYESFIFLSGNLQLNAGIRWHIDISHKNFSQGALRIINLLQNKIKRSKQAE